MEVCPVLRQDAEARAIASTVISFPRFFPSALHALKSSASLYQGQAMIEWEGRAPGSALALEVRHVQEPRSQRYGCQRQPHSRPHRQPIVLVNLHTRAAVVTRLLCAGFCSPS